MEIFRKIEKNHFGSVQEIKQYAKTILGKRITINNRIDDNRGIRDISYGKRGEMFLVSVAFFPSTIEGGYKFSSARIVFKRSEQNPQSGHSNAWDLEEQYRANVNRIVVPKPFLLKHPFGIYGSWNIGYENIESIMEEEKQLEFVF